VNLAAPGRKAWVLSQEAFDKLLAHLNPDRERAGGAYEMLRLKLTRLFEWRGTTSPEDMADETIDRVARRLLEGVEITTGDIYLFFRGVAMNVLHEYWHRQAEHPEPPPPSPPPPAERLLELLEKAMESLTSEEREIVGQYYQGSKLKDSRRALGIRLDLTPNALRIRACRARDKLEAYVREHRAAET
jgi:DNA-directed RNA polymerase specialized sigma24 family protein